MWKYKSIYLLILPTFLFFFVFVYMPYYGLLIAFQDYSILRGVTGSKFAGLKYFKMFFESDNFFLVVRNTLSISVLRLIFSFPLPIMFALLINEVRHYQYKRVVQTVTYFPHFLNWVIFAGIVIELIKPSGIINKLFEMAGLSAPNIQTSQKYFVPMLIVSDNIKSFGFGSIIYLAAISGVDSQLYEAAAMDGVNKFRQFWHVTLPAIRPTIIVMFVLAIGGILNAGFDQIFFLYNAAVYDVADIIDTFVFRVGFLGNQFSLGTAVGIFKGVIGLVLIIGANAVIRKTGEASIW
jgi:putative aldouronate transport system permease protein